MKYCRNGVEKRYKDRDYALVAMKGNDQNGTILQIQTRLKMPFFKKQTKTKQNHCQYFLQFKECWIPKSQRHARTTSQKTSENMSYQEIIEKPEMAAIRENRGQQEYIHHLSLQANYSSSGCFWLTGSSWKYLFSHIPCLFLGTQGQISLSESRSRSGPLWLSLGENATLFPNMRLGLTIQEEVRTQAACVYKSGHI